MVSRETLNQRMRKLKEDRSNNFCFDCGHEDPQFASVNHGIFLCDQCVNSHKSLGTHLSLIQNASDGIWTIKQLRTMSLGGNTAFKRFLCSYGISETRIIDIYRMRCARYYREMLKEVVDGRIYQEIQPSLEEGLEIVEEELKAEETSIKSGFSWKNVLGSAVLASKSMTKNFTKKIKDISEKPAFQEWEQKAESVFAKIENGFIESTNSMIDRTRELRNAEIMQNLSEGTKNALTKITEKVKKTYELAYNDPNEELESVYSSMTEEMNPPTPPEYK